MNQKVNETKTATENVCFVIKHTGSAIGKIKETTLDG